MAGGEGLLIELHQEMRVISTGEPSVRDALPVAISGVDGGTGRVLPPAGNNHAGDWLITVTTQSNKRLELIQTRSKPRIQKVPKLLREAGNNRPFFEPEVVSLGPYHHGRPDLAGMEEHKMAAAARYAGEQYQAVPMRLFYDKVRDLVGEARACYADNFDEFSDDDFAKMMFFDGCFILHFIECYLKDDGASPPTTNAHLQGFITRDIFLLENQVPFKVLKALMSLRAVGYEGFITKLTGHTISAKKGRQTQERGVEEDPIHLLDLLRIRLLGGELRQKPSPSGASWQCFRSVMELKEAGITFRKSETWCLRDVTFQKGRVHGRLQLPQIVVDDLTRPRFLNLVALEMCPDCSADYGVISYVCFLDQLIDHAEDVKELRRKEILLNALGSDQQVADLFNELATGLSPDHSAYSQAVMGITGHYKNKRKVSIVRMLHAHFSSPWTTISFIAAVFLLILTTLQTFFAIFSKFAVAS